VEGTSPRYAPQEGSSTFNSRKHPDVPWAFPGSDLTAVILGQGGTIWRMADASAPDAQGWQQIPVDPLVVAARVAGISYGFLVFDDTGSEWTRNGEEFRHRTFPNRFFYSREAGAADAPYITVVLGPQDKEPPPAPSRLSAEVGQLPAGQAKVSWITPDDRGPAGTIGFLVEVNGKEVPRYLIPAAGQPGQKVTMRLRDLGLAAGAQVELSVKAVDAAGNVGPGSTHSFRVSDRAAKPLPGKSPQPYQSGAPLPQLGRAQVAILDELDKVQPVNGEMIPQQSPDYPAANHLWSAREKRIRLAGARNEFVAFQIHFIGPVEGVQPSLEFDDNPPAGIRVEFGRYRHVMSKKGPLPDPIVPLEGPFQVPSADQQIPGQQRGSLLCEIYVPHEAAAGSHPGTLVLRSGNQTLQLGVVLWVWDFTLPDALSFLPEMNCYGLPENERDYYRLAHRHRTVLNRVPYSQSGSVHEGCVPKWDGQKLDWSDWDKRFGPYFDGSAFADLPRKRVPLECFYLPLHENWPGTMEGNYDGNYWADEAFAPGYRQTFAEVARQMAQHFQSKGWRQTIFQCYLNNKNDFKERGWSRGSSPWLLDEPANFQDYWALRWFGEAFHEGVRQALDAQGKAKLCFRCDISRPQWQRDALDHVLDYNVVGGGAFRRYHRAVLDRKEAFGQIVLDYGSTNAIEESNLQPVGWCLDSWTLGSDGVLPWQTIGNAGSWKEGDPLSLFYPARGEPVPSVRLKAYRRGQQDVEYLRLLAEAQGEPYWALGEAVRRELRLKGEHVGTGFTGGEDAGLVRYQDLRPQEVWALRVRVGRVLSDLRPTTKRGMIEFRTPPRDPTRSPPAKCQPANHSPT